MIYAETAARATVTVLSAISRGRGARLSRGARLIQMVERLYITVTTEKVRHQQRHTSWVKRKKRLTSYHDNTIESGAIYGSIAQKLR